MSLNKDKRKNSEEKAVAAAGGDRENVSVAQGDRAETDGTSAPKPKKRSALRITLKVLAWTVGSLVGLLLIVMCLIAWILTPERLTPLVNEYASEYLKADVKAGRVELTVWRSFPYVKVDVNDLHITSRTLQGQPDSVMRALPADASKLLDSQEIHASINPWHMLRGVIKLGDINVNGLGVNLVSYSATVNNYDIVPPSEEKEEKESKPWRIELANVEILAQGGIRYFDAASGLDVVLRRPTVRATHKDDNLKIDFRTAGDLAMNGRKVIENMPFTLGGDLSFKQDPMALSCPELTVTAWNLPAYIDFALDLGSRPALTKGAVKVPAIEILPVLKLVVPELIAETPLLKGLDTNLAVALDATVATPWAFESKELPNVTVNYRIPDCRLNLAVGSNRLSVSNLTLQGDFFYNGAHPELSTAAIPLFTCRGEGIELSLTAEVREALSGNPLLALTSKGSTDLSNFRVLLPIQGALLGGTVDANASLTCRLSDILETRWGNIKADGEVQIRNFLFSIPVMTTRIYSRLATLTFGSNVAESAASRMLVSDRLRAAAAIDTLYCAVPGIELGLGNMNFHAGTTEKMLAAHTSKEVIPLAMSLTAGRVEADSETDTLHLRARGLEAFGKVTRYQGKSESPLMQALFKADKVRYTDPATRLSVRNFSADVTAHLRERKPKDKTAYQRRYDAIAKANPGLSADSIAKLASMPRRKRPQVPVVDMSVDNGLKALIRQWGVQGSVKADRTNLTYIMYPVKTRLTNLSLDFSLDSVRLHRAYLSSQNNRLSLHGTISNLRQAMLGRTRTPLKVRLWADIDSIDINQIAYNYELGQGLIASRGVLAKISPEDENLLVRAAATRAAAPSEPIDTTTLIIPRNIDAHIYLTSREALYTNIALHNLRGSLIMNDGAVSLDSLTAGTDFGDAYANLLYDSRNPQDLNMSVDLGFSNVSLADFYSTFPQVVEMAPMITNLNGMVGASLTGSFSMFPNMDIDMGSINAMLNITGTDLKVTQDPLIRKVARMMLIRKKGDLNISDMNIQLSVHDNVMRLYPFAFSMEKYKFALLGENDLNQNMYYHLSVLKSPIPWKFGINIKGTFDHPKFRFGGAKYHENQAREVVNLVKVERVNFVKAMRLQLRKLVDKAALNYADRQEPDQAAERLDQNMQETTLNNPTDVLRNSLTGPLSKVLGNNANLLKEALEKSKKNKK